MMRRLGRAGLVALVVVVGLLVSARALSMPLPDGPTGPDADAAMRAMVQAVDGDAWDRTGAVTWTFAGRNHLWDRVRHLDRVTTGSTVTLVNLDTQAGVATKNGTRLEGRAADKAVASAYAAWINDSFWLNPVVKAFDPPVERRLVSDEGHPAVLVTYKSGGLTPGDSYLWAAGPDGPPAYWRLWVSIIPIKGLKASFEGWTTLRTGAKVSTVHRAGFLTLTLTDVDGAATLSELVPGPDPFAAIAR
jgi:hypothetical protein